MEKGRPPPEGEIAGIENIGPFGVTSSEALIGIRSYQLRLPAPS